MKHFNVAIIGGGVIGCLIARELSFFDIKSCLIEKENDVGNKTSSANSAIVHSGYDPVPGTLKAKFNVLGNPMFDNLCKELNVDFVRNGSLTVAVNEEEFTRLKTLSDNAKQNGVEVKILNKEETLKIEPHINKSIYGSLYAPTAGMVNPFQLCVKAMENAMDNGTILFLENEVLSISKLVFGYSIKTNKEEINADIIINCAGNYADKIASMIENIDWRIIPKKGEYFVLDHFNESFVKHVLFPMPSNKGKGILITPTTAGNYLIGPSSEINDDKDDYSTDFLTLENIKSKAKLIIDDIPFNEVIRVFSGLRPSSTRHDFIIERSNKYETFINVAGIESPGLASSPAIAKYVIEVLLSPLIELKFKDNYSRVVRPFIKTDKDNEIICNCEQITKSEILDCLSRNCAPRSIKGVKRRTRAGFGKCQGGFCQSKVLFLLAKHYGVSPLEIPFDSNGSQILTSIIKGKENEKC